MILELGVFIVFLFSLIMHFICQSAESNVNSKSINIIIIIRLYLVTLLLADGSITADCALV